MISDPVILALQQQVDCYRRLSKLAEIQHEHVQQSRIEDLLDVLGRRQQVLDRVAELEQTIGPAKRCWGEYVSGLEGPGRAQAEDLLAESRRLLELITLSDRQDTMVLQMRKVHLGKQITQASAAKQINRTYAAAAYGPRSSKMDLQR